MRWRCTKGHEWETPDVYFDLGEHKITLQLYSIKFENLCMRCLEETMTRLLTDVGRVEVVPP